MFLTQAVVPTMARQERGVIINLTSVHAFAGMTGHPVYAATKGAIIAYTREVALELIPKGIRVNAIAPGWVRVENQERAFGATSIGSVKPAWCPSVLPLFLLILREIVMFLCSEDSRFILADACRRWRAAGNYAVDGRFQTAARPAIWCPIRRVRVASARCDASQQLLNQRQLDLKPENLSRL